MKKRLISLLLAFVLLIGCFAVSASALDEVYSDALGGAYGDIYPSNGSGKEVSAQYLYGANDYMYFEIDSKGYENVAFCCGIFADKAMTQSVGTFVDTEPSTSGKSVASRVATSIFPKNGTYYACSFVLIYDGEDYCMDEDSVREFTVNVSKNVTDIKKLTPVIAFADTVNGPCVKWYGVSGAKYYYIYRKLKDSDPWTRIGTASSGVRSFTDKGANKTGEYIYTVRAVDANGNLSKFTPVTHYFVAAAQKITAAAAADNNVKVQWSKVAGVSGYIVYRRTGNGSWQKLGTVKGADNCQFADKTAKDNYTLYNYTVKSYKSVGGEILYSKYIDGGSIVFMAAPVLNAPAAASGNIKITWNKTAGADSYIIYRSPLITADGTVKWTKLAAIPGSTAAYTDKSASSDGKYTYTVRSVYGGVNGSYSSKGTSYIKTPALVSAAETSDNGIVLKWNKSAGATGYYVYRKTADTSWARIATVGNQASYTDYSDKVNGVEYIYTVKAFAYSSAITSGFDKNGLKIKHIEAPVITSAEPYDSVVRLTWNPVSGASAYTVYRKNTASDGWTNIAKVSGSTAFYVDDSAWCSNSYIYTVRAEGTSSRGSYSGEGAKYYGVADKRSIFNEYKAAAHSVALNGNCSYNKKEWQTVENLECGSVGAILQPILDGYITTEAQAEVQFTEKGEKSKMRFPDCTLTDMSKVVSAEKNGNVITIVLADEDTPQNASTSFLAQVSNSVVYWEDVEKELKGISVVKGYENTQLLHKGYKITAEIADGRFVSLKHEGVIYFNCPNAKVTVFSLPLSGTVNTYSVYDNFVY